MKALSVIAVIVLIAVLLAGCAAPTPTPPPDTKGKGTASSVSLVNPPSTGKGGESSLVCWRVEGTGNVPHTAIHHGPASHTAAGTKFSDYPNTIYPGNATAAAAGGYNLPATFCASVAVPADADVYLRAHVIDVSGGDGRLAAEHTIWRLGGGEATSVDWSGTVPPSATAGGKVEVCWRVEGSGNVAHTAVHSDTESHATETGAVFSDYDGTAYYPDGEAAAAAGGYNLPGPFCTDVDAPETPGDTVYIRSHVIDKDGGNGELSPTERSITATHPKGQGVALTVDWSGTVPTAWPAGTLATVCWEVTGTGNVAHTAVHADNETHADELDAAFTDYDGTAYYPDNETAESDDGYDLPGVFCTGVAVPATAGETVFLRGHVIDSAGGTGRLTLTEESITAGSSATNVDWEGTPAETAAAGTNVLVCWRVEGTGNVPHTAIHTDNETHAADTAAAYTDYDVAAYYPNNESAENASGYTLPGPFCTNVPAPATAAQVLYLRAHVIDSAGGNGKLSATERTITAT